MLRKEIKIYQALLLLTVIFNLCLNLKDDVINNSEEKEYLLYIKVDLGLLRSNVSSSVLRTPVYTRLNHNFVPFKMCFTSEILNYIQIDTRIL